MMVPPYSLRHSHTRATNSSRPRSSLVRPLARSIFSTTFCVAMPAWSVPTSQQAFSPSMRWYRVSTSWMVSLSAWPMCSTPVMLGGGMTMEYAGRSGSGSAWKRCSSSQCFIQRASTAAGSKRVVCCR